MSYIAQWELKVKLKIGKYKLLLIILRLKDWITHFFEFRKAQTQQEVRSRILLIKRLIGKLD